MSSSKPDALETRSRRRVGTTIGGKYKLEEVIGVGGMATVYLGVHRNGNRVAIKMLHAELALEEGLAERFVREGYVGNAIGHPGTVRVIDDDRTEDGAAFLVMELLEGETLHQRGLRQGGRLSPRELLPLAHELCDVLAAAHERGVVHRDIKPENLFVTREGALKVLDFGIARVRDGSNADATQTGRTLGTPAFMPPEQALGRTDEIDGRTDVWAVGATLFTLISGEYVHEARTGPEFVVATATRPPRSLAAVSRETPAVIVEVVDRALRFAKDDRWPSAPAMRDALSVAFVEVYGAPISSVLRLIPAPVSSSGSLRLGGASPSGSAAEQVTMLAPATGSGARPSGDRTPAGGAGAARRSASSTAPTLEVESGRSAPPPTPTVQAAARKSDGRLLLLALLCLGGGLLISLGVQRIWRGSSPTASTASTESAAGTVSAAAQGSAAPPPGCATNRECREKLGRAAICRPDRAACAPLEAEGCRVLAEPGNVENESTLWFGAMFPVTGIGSKEYGLASVNAVDLARRDFMDIASGLPSARSGAPPRPMAVVVCDDSGDPARVVAHLVDGLGVPAIIGFARSKEVLDLSATVFTPKGVLALASNTASMLRDIPHAPGEPRMVWRTTTSSLMDAPAFAAVLSEVVEPELRSGAAALSADDRVRVALITVNNPSGTGYADLLISRLRYNGRSVAENGADFRVVVAKDLPDEQVPADTARVASEVAAFRPHVILRLVDPPDLVSEIEKRWPAEQRVRPRYLMGSVEVEGTLQRAVQEHPDLKKRLYGVSTPAGSAVVAKFVARYNELYSPKVTSTSVTDAPYDAYYLLAYAAAALGEEPITGRGLGRAIARLVPPGTPIEVGPGSIYQAIGLLRAGKNIDLRGTTTTLDYDLETGEPTADFSIFCLKGGEKGEALTLVESGMTFVARTAKLAGAIRCP
jgi:serine/threonine-protein kinase